MVRDFRSLTNKNDANLTLVCFVLIYFMRILVACEESGIVRDAFIAKGHDAISCDILPTAKPGPHLQQDVIPLLNDSWDMVIAFPPCTDLCVSGARWFKEKQKSGAQQKSIDFFMSFTQLKCKWAIENPVGIMSKQYRKPNQIIEPWFFGHDEPKATCLWLHNLPLLRPENIYMGPLTPRIHLMSPGPERAKLRSRTFQGIANAMANQWG